MNQDLSNSISAVGVNGLLSIVISLICIALAWWALQQVKLDLVVRHPKGPQGKLLHLLLAVVLGRFVAEFLIDYITWSQMIRYMF
ncbi:hypothetical protein PVOR_31976 [Paenibacillus vortex V453]|jgi:uncharacterized integral membrane protein (TIGR02327 family)|uniref:DUF1146 domain-containing protein n=2 Tax=Paenibacillus TaxID=44249 RepID=A0A163I806_9BACL|nr:MULTISPECIES: DUF1146 family protein [Paenibacillus]ANA79812.1 hypothetical protein A3958_07435 [Paenibacillus glucanolyticus]AVV56163.1 DUF1146 domain-containing protein [Paenibacillus glucanolyticus]AWP30701.1 hypothetical protein B9D94_30615 [Paenibacillus sp. Cedars]EFU38048.1 hypothetical protein PVOR_31976 [Paenibacillus vortex V453]ETT38188.1 hypothetical protein C169_11277 [Paenibacillus sp. FSL R5-808]